MSDPEEATAPPAPASNGSTRLPPGPQPTYLDQRQKDGLLDLMESGKGSELALRMLKIGRRAYRNTIRDDADFADEVEGARLAADQSLEEHGFLTAKSGDADFLLEMLKRRDRARELNRAQRERRRERAEDDERRQRERAEDREEKRIDRAMRIHLAEIAERERERVRASKDGKTENEDVGLDLSRLTPEELATFRDLAAKIKPAADGEPGN